MLMAVEPIWQILWSVRSAAPIPGAVISRRIELEGLHYSSVHSLPPCHPVKENEDAHPPPESPRTGAMVACPAAGSPRMDQPLGWPGVRWRVWSPRSTSAAG